MSHLQRESTEYLARSVWLPIITGAFFLIAAWGIYLLAALRNVNLLNSQAVTPGLLTTYLAIAAAVTLATPIVVWRKIRLTLDLIARGRRADATVASIGGAAMHGLTPVTFAYVVDGVRHTLKRDMPMSTFDAFAPDTVVGVAYDPRNPRRAQVLENEFPAEPEQSLKEVTVDGVKKVATDTLYWVALVALAVAQGLLFVWILARYDLDGDNTRRFGVPILLGAIGLAVGELELWGHLRGQVVDWRAAKSVRNTRVFAAVLIAASVVWTFVAAGDVRRDLAQRTRDEADKQSLREQMRQAEKTMADYRTLTEHLATRPSRKK